MPRPLFDTHEQGGLLHTQTSASPLGEEFAGERLRGGPWFSFEIGDN
jgi:hypothetical protein